MDEKKVNNLKSSWRSEDKTKEAGKKIEEKL